MVMFTLRTVTSAGALDKPLPDYESLTLSPQFCKAGTVSIKYPARGKNFDLLADDVEIAVLMDGVEVESLRGIIESSDGNDASEASDVEVWTFTARTTLALFDRAVVYPQNYPATNPPSHSFVAATPGAIVIELIQAAQARGALLGVTWDFTSAVDSLGQAWPLVYDLSFDAGTKYSEVLDSLVENGVLEIEMEARTLRAFGVGSLGSDKSTGSNPLRFQKGRDIKDSPRKSKTRELATTVLVAGDDNVYTERESDAATMSQWGRREASYSQQGITNEGVLSVVGDWYLGTVNRPIMEVTHGLYFEDPNSPVPITDFVVGDWGLSDVGRGWESLRIKQWTAEVASSGEVTGSVVLNDLIQERIEKLSHRLDRIQNGTTATGGSEEKDDGKSPAFPGSVLLSSDFYINNSGFPRATLEVSWSPVTTNQDGTALTDLEGYRVRWRYQSDDTFWREVAIRDASDTVAYFGDLITNQAVEVEVQAFDRYGRSSGWSSAYTSTTAADSVAPAKPSAPVVTTRVGTLRVSWDGLDYLGQTMAADLAGVEVHIGPNGTFTPDATTRVDTIPAAAETSVTVTTELDYNTEYWARLVAYDHSRNYSPPSDETAESHATLTQVVHTDIGTGQVGLNNTRFSDIGNLVEDGSFENIALRVNRQAEMTGTRYSFDNTTSSNGFWSVKMVGTAGSSPSQLITLQEGLPVKPGELIFGAADYRLSVDAGDPVVGVAVAFFNRDGQIITSSGTPADWDWGGVLHFVTADTGLPLDDQWHTRVTNIPVTVFDEAVTMGVYLRSYNHYSGTAWIDSVEIRRQVDTLLVGDAAITNAKIANLAVNNAKIADLEVGKLTTGTLSADITVSSRIKTADTGSRVELNSGGIEVWDANGVQTVAMDAATGSVDLLGTLRSGFAGNRVVIHPEDTSLPEVRFYPTSGSNYAYLNAFSPGSSQVNVGLNSGTFTRNAETCHNRLYMGEGFLQLETVRSSDQAQKGAHLYLMEEWTSVGRDSNDSTDNWIDFWDSGKMFFRGEVSFRNDIDNNCIIPWRVEWSNGPFNTYTIGWGASQRSIPEVIAQLSDPQASGAGIGSSVENLTGTGFTINFDGASTGSVGAVNYWAWRN